MLSTLVIGTLCGLTATWVVRLLALRFSFLSYPNPIVKDHRNPVPYLGGLGIGFGASLAWLLTSREIGPFQWIAFAGFWAFALLGLVDDLSPLSPITKIVAQAFICSVVILVARLDGPMAATSLKITGMTAAQAVGSITWLVAIVNAANFIDVCDGLAASVSFPVFLCWVWLAPSATSSLFAAVAGALLGFLWWNKPRARIYMGDSGSQALGYLLGIAVLDHFFGCPLPTYILAAVCFTGVPFFELVFVTSVRIQKGLPWWKGSPDHFALRLQQAGFSKAQIDLLASGISMALWLCGLVITRASTSIIALVVMVLATGAILCWKWLLSWEVQSI